MTLPHLARPFLALPLCLSLVACDGGENNESESASSTGADLDPDVIPTNSAQLLPWLMASYYTDWSAESDVHASSGPHGDVRTFINPELEMSLQAAAGEHPVGSAAVKELYSSGTLIGWAVMVKTQAQSAGGDGWYWYEKLGNSVEADGNGVGLCTGCHSAGSIDLFRSPYPLQ